MTLFLPTVTLNHVTELKPSLLKSLKVKAVLLDVDNTLAFHGSQQPFLGTIEWSRTLQDEGFRLIILSNNFQRRVAPFAAQFSLPFYSMAMKPLPAAYIRAAHKVGASHENAVVVGDQIFTDILGANLAGMKSVLVMPQKAENSLSFRIRRKLEEPIRKKINQKNEKLSMHRG